MNYNHDVRAHITSLEHSKFIEIQDTRYPAVSVIRVQYPESNLMPPISTTEIYPKHALLAYIANPEDISGGGGGSVGGGNTDTLLNTLTSQVARIESLVDALTAQNTVVLNWSAVSVLVSDHLVAFPTTPATTVSIINNTGVGILIQNGASVPAFPLPWGGAIEISTIANASEIRMIREDGSNIPVEVFGFVTLKG